MKLEKLADRVFKLLKGNGYGIKIYSEDGQETAIPSEGTRFFVKTPNLMVSVTENEIQINKNSSLLKENKIKKAATLEELPNDTKISLSNLHVLCLYNRINIVYIYKQSYSILQGGEDDEPFSIIYNDYNKIKCQVNVSKDKINNIKKTFFNITNSFKSCSYYKLNELKEIAEKLKIGLQNDKGKPKTKSHLYSNIQVWGNDPDFAAPC